MNRNMVEKAPRVSCGSKFSYAPDSFLPLRQFRGLSDLVINRSVLDNYLSVPFLGLCGCPLPSTTPDSFSSPQTLRDRWEPPT